MAKGHRYAFNMGSTNIIPFQNYQEAAKELMERNMWDVLYDRQTTVIFLPESHLPNVPRAVDLQEYWAKKRKLSDDGLAA